jgi:hypothetical protein
MSSHDGVTHQNRREFLRKAIPAGAVCAGCPGLWKLDLLAGVDGGGQEVHKFLQDAGMTFEQAFQFAYSSTLVPYLRGFGKDMDPEEFLAQLKELSSERARAMFSGFARQVPNNDLATFTAPYVDPNSRNAQVLTIEIVESTEDVCEFRVTECLWTKTFIDAGAADLGLACICHPDYAAIEAFNPEYEMVRDKTLMEGHDCCNHRYRRKAAVSDRS